MSRTPYLEKGENHNNTSPYLLGPEGQGGLPGGAAVKNLPASAGEGDTGDAGSIPGLGRSPGEGNGNPLQYSCLQNPVDRGAWLATVCGVIKSQTRLSMHSRGQGNTV